MPGAADAYTLLRPGLLDGVHVLVATAAPSGPIAATGEHARFADAVAATCSGLGARVSTWRPADALPAGVDQLVVDCTAPFAQPRAQVQAQAGPGARAGDAEPGSGARDALRDCLDGAWQATRAVATAAFIDSGRPGRVVYIAPVAASDRARDAAHADAARAGLENLSRTLSIEWARYAITLVTIAPGERTSAAEVAAATAFLGSTAGAYFSGCLFDLRGLGRGGV
jgi:NAD(P)-dependent dehydrogenase (short-subunit alcohol dehydrogenase family)